ncbi:MFS transporter [Catenulispora sp. NL8]|uniref:MFS transporter n=1 Tax=Catenulispora pinistramenti TaxID=2705254 RepID=A0ABS5L1J6_9ACTN|nr:MFS transporter [Catenulispora pinistramenti]MBS2552206.1 MFS transporter [Catenulispora pinistramenti]
MSASFLSTGRGKVILLLLCGVAFLDLVDASIVNVALPSIRKDLRFSTQGLQWVPSGYLLTYGGFMLLGGRAADLFGRRRVLVAGTTVFGLASLAGGFADSAGLLVGARLVQGVGAALMMPAALSLLTTTFKEGSDRTKAFGAWGAVAGLASAVGVLAGGLLTDGPGWRWVMFVNPPFCVLILVAVFRMFEADGKRVAVKGLDLVGAFLATAGMLLLVFGLVKAPDQGWGSGRTVLELGGAGVLLVTFIVNERNTGDPLLPLSVFRIRGLVAANVTQLVGVAGFLSFFFFLTLYMQNVEGYSPIRAGLAYLPITVAVGIGAALAPKVVARVGTRPVAVVGAAVAAVGIYLLAGLKVHGSYDSGLLPGMVVMAFGLGLLFVAIATAANAGVPHHQAGLAAALLNASQQVGGALGLAIFAAISTARLNHELNSGVRPAAAMASGLSWALTSCAIAVACAAVIALRTRNVHSEAEAEALAAVEEDLVAVN